MKPSKHRHALDEKEIIAQHFSRLTYLLREEEKFQRNDFRENVLDKSPEDQQRGGRALLRLNLVDSRYNPSGQRLISFALPSRRPLPRYSLQVGDVVRVSGIATPENEKQTGTVYEKERSVLTVAFNRQLPGWIGTEQFYNLVLTENQTTYDRMYEALRLVGHAAHNQIAHLRDISLGFRKIRLHDPVRPQELSFFNTQLNELQKKAVCKAIEVEDILLVHGPPGTGKTSVLIEIIRQARKRGEAVLVSAPSNAACDHILNCLVNCGEAVTRLGHPARMAEHLRDHTLGFKLTRHPFAKLINEHEARLDQLSKQSGRRQDRRVMSWDEKRETRDEIRQIRDDIRALRTEIFNQVWHVSDIVIATHTVCADPMLKGKVFDWVIVDEATQSIEPATWIPAMHAGRLILAGDHCQLPPTVFSPKMGRETLRFTLFERLYEKVDEACRIRLEEQYRMHEQIMNFSSREFYDGKLRASPDASGRLLTELEGVRDQDETKTPVTFLDTAGLGYEEKLDPSTKSRFNRDEAELAADQYRRLVDAGVSPRDIAIISPYSAQVKLLAGMLIPEGWDADKENVPEIDSIDAFQGREKEAVIVSLVRSNLTGDLGFLSDTRRMNVALTRARRKLIVIGDSATISSLPFYADFLTYVDSVSAYKSAWEYRL